MLSQAKGSYLIVDDNEKIRKMKRRIEQLCKSSNIRVSDRRRCTFYRSSLTFHNQNADRGGHHDDGDHDDDDNN